MKGIGIASVLLSSLLSLVLACGAGEAHAAPPAQRTLDASASFEVDFLTQACGFPVVYTREGTITYTDFGPHQGDITEHVGYRLTVSFSANGLTLSANANGPVTMVFHEDGSATEYDRGTYAFTTAPGAGPVFGAAGLTIVNWAPPPGGVTSMLVHGLTVDETKLCTALTP